MGAAAAPQWAKTKGGVAPSYPIEKRREAARHRAVAVAMTRLPEEQRTAIVLKEYHGLTFQEIADMLDCPLSTVKTRLYQGLSVLRRQLDREGVGRNHV